MIFKLIKTTLLSLTIIISHSISLESSFRQSKEQDFQEALAYAKTHNPEKSDQQIKDLILAMSTAASNKDKIMSLQNLKKRLLQRSENETEAIAEQIQDIADSFDILKKRMRVPAEVEMVFLQDDTEDALYNVFDRKVYISPRFLGDTPSKKLFKLIHELTHGKQHQAAGIVPMTNGTKSFEHEHQADTQAAQAISCPTCMQIIEDDYSYDTDRATLGYLTKADIAAHKAHKKNQDTCDAHKANNKANQQLKELFPDKFKSLNVFQKAWEWWQADKKAIQRATLDFDIGSMRDRLSSVRLP